MWDRIRFPAAPKYVLDARQYLPRRILPPVSPAVKWTALAVAALLALPWLIRGYLTWWTWAFGGRFVDWLFGLR